jgi:hypothetical protein
VLVSCGPGTNHPGKYSTYPHGASCPAGTSITSRTSKARDHRNNRLDTEELDALLARDSFDAADEDLMHRFRELIPEDFAEGLRLAVAEAECNREAEPAQ